MFSRNTAYMEEKIGLACPGQSCRQPQASGTRRRLVLDSASTRRTGEAFPTGFQWSNPTKRNARTTGVKDSIHFPAERAHVGERGSQWFSESGETTFYTNSLKWSFGCWIWISIIWVFTGWTFLSVAVSLNL